MYLLLRISMLERQRRPSGCCTTLGCWLCRERSIMVQLLWIIWSKNDNEELLSGLLLLRLTGMDTKSISLILQGTSISPLKWKGHSGFAMVPLLYLMLCKALRLRARRCGCKQIDSRYHALVSSISLIELVR